MRFSEIENKLYGWRVRSSFLGILASLILSKPTQGSLIVGIGLCSLGLALRAWASGHIRKGKELTTSGPYRYSRNPLYLGNLIIGLSLVLSSRSIWVLLAFTAYFVLFYPLAIKIEKEKMERVFPEEYRNYKNKVPIFFPKLKTSPHKEKKKFSFNLYWRNKEYRALGGALLYWLLIVLKMAHFYT